MKKLNKKIIEMDESMNEIVILCSKRKLKKIIKKIKKDKG